ncbi:hypothetical protein [Paenibacillus kandeliae]|uniref:hypothetical protein n=1 Tax=Paenibacillus kandeliae TaxID=3231269 RepID=UPI003457907D
MSRSSSRSTNTNVQLQPIIDMGESMSGFQIVSVQMGADGYIYVLLIDELPSRINGMFVPSVLKNDYTYQVLQIADGIIQQQVTLPNQHFNYHYIQPLHDELLLVGARCHYYGQDRYDRNAAVFHWNGQLVREFLLGDGIQQVQVTKSGTIWTSYFDEGIFGNHGWKHPVGANGLIAWDAHGEKLYSNDKVDIVDCYALNVINDKEIWFYYYTDFMLGRISGSLSQPHIDMVQPNVSGSYGFCTDGYHFLFDGGYDKHGSLILKKTNKPNILSKGQSIQLMDETGHTLQMICSDFRGDSLVIYNDNRLYMVTMEEIVHAAASH